MNHCACDLKSPACLSMVLHACSKRLVRRVILRVQFLMFFVYGFADKLVNCQRPSISEIFFEHVYFSSGNFSFKPSGVRSLRKNERGVFVLRTLRFFKVQCHACSYVTLIPTYGKFEVPSSVHCEGCGKVILVKWPY